MIRAKEVPVSYGSYGKEYEAEDYKAIVRQDEPETLYGIVSTNYMLIQHDDMYQWTRDIANQVYGKGNYNIDHKVQWNGARLYLKVLGKSKHEIAKDDSVRLGFSVTNSYDATLGIWTEGFGFREICQNGMLFGKERFKLLKSLHTRAKESPKDVFPVLEGNITEIVDAQNEFLEVLEIAKNTSVDLEAVMKKVKMPKKYKDAIISNFQSKSGETVYDLYNEVTAEVTHNLDTENELRRIRYLREAEKVLATV